MGDYLVKITNYLWSQSCQLIILIIVIAALSWILKSRSAHIRYLLWLTVIGKCIIPPLFIIPLAILPQQKTFKQLSPSVESMIALNTSEVKDTAATQTKPNRFVIPSVGQITGVIWLAGVAVFCFISMSKILKSNLELKQQRRPLPNELRANIEEIFKEFKLRILPKVWLLEGIGQPFVWGTFRGSIYLPTNYLKIDNVIKRRDILGHEVCHIFRLDAAVNSLQVLAQAIFWFHPFVWWANQKMRQEREKCCDEMVVAHLNIKAKEYSTSIVKMLISENKSNRPVPKLAVAGPAKDIEERIKTMLEPGKKFYKHPSVAAALVILFIALITIPTALVLTAKAQTQPTATSSAKIPTDSNNIEQPRYTARTFNSDIALEVWIQETSSPETERQIGSTPNATPLEIPSCWLWGFRISAPVKDWDMLKREINQKDVPYMRLINSVDSDMKEVANLVKLLSLDLRNSKITNAGLEHLKSMSQLEELVLMDTPITDAGLEQIKNMTKLQSLNLNNTKITDTSLESLKGLTELKNLYLVNTKISDAGMEHIKSMTKLQGLGLHNTKITDTGLEFLKGLTELTGLDLANTEITDAGLKNLKEMHKLQTLWVSGTNITDKGLEHIQGLITLQTIVLQTPQITDDGIGNLKNMTGLQRLILQGTQVTDTGIQKLKQSIPNVNIVSLPPTTRSTDKPLTDSQKEDQSRYTARTFNSNIAFEVWIQDAFPNPGRQIGHTPSATPLDIPSCWLWGVQPSAKVNDWDEVIQEISQNNVPGIRLDAVDSDLEQLRRLEKLRSLNLMGSKITDAGLKYLETMSQLEQLDLMYTPITDAGLEYIKSMTSLKNLNLYATKITDIGMDHIKNMTNLQSLICGNTTQITDVGLENLKGMSRLKQLNLMNTPITDLGIEHINGLSGLQILVLNNTNITDAGLENLKRMTGMQNLELANTKITDAGIEKLKGMTELKSLTLMNTPITDTGLQNIQGLNGLQNLLLGNTKVTDRGMEYLKNMNGLQILVLMNTPITDKGLENLKGMTNMQRLALDSTKITDVGLEHIKNMTNLQTLLLNGTLVTDEGLKQIKGLTSLQILNLNDTKITDVGMEYIKGLTGLQRLFLSNTNVTDAGIQLLKQSIPNVTITK